MNNNKKATILIDSGFNFLNMKQYFIRFRAEYYCQGYEFGWFERLVYANSYEEACNKIKNMKTPDWEKGTADYFKNLTI